MTLVDYHIKSTSTSFSTTSTYYGIDSIAVPVCLCYRTLFSQLCVQGPFVTRGTEQAYSFAQRGRQRDHATFHGLLDAFCASGITKKRGIQAVVVVVVVVG